MAGVPPHALGARRDLPTGVAASKLFEHACDCAVDEAVAVARLIAEQIRATRDPPGVRARLPREERDTGCPCVGADVSTRHCGRAVDAGRTDPLT